MLWKTPDWWYLLISPDRYLTKIVDQLYCLISPNHASSLVWAESAHGELGFGGRGDNKPGRMFTFEVMKTNEQEESVVPRPGINVRVFFSLWLFNAQSKAG